MDPTNTHLQTLFDQAPEEIQDYFLSGELEKEVILLGKIHKLPISAYVTLKNTITLTLLGVITPETIIPALEKNCNLNDVEATELVKDIDQAIFQKVRFSVLGNTAPGVKQITLSDGGNATAVELRKELLDTTKGPMPKIKEGVVEASGTTGEIKRSSSALQQASNLQPGSRAQLLEQLHVLQTIPNDEEVEARLNHIKEQVATLESAKETRALETTVPADDFTFGDKGDTVVEAQPQAATYSKAPTQYNIDPYRELVED